MNKIRRHFFAKYQQHKLVKEFNPLIEFKDKRLVVIGAADTALVEKNGRKIDNSDIVIRINKAPHAWTPEMESFLGKKTDILYHSFFENEESGGGRIEVELYNKFGIQKIINPNNNKLGRKAQLNFYKRHETPIQTFILQKQISERIRSEFDNFLPTIGFYALASALLAETKELYVTGFTFFKTPYYKGYRKNLEDSNKNEIHIENQGLHNPDLEFEVFKFFFNQSPSKKIILDQYLSKLLDSEN